MNTLALELHDVHHAYGSTPSLSGVTFSLAAGRIGCLLGPSGSGKSTILRCIAGFESIHQGSIRINGQLVADPKFSQTPEQRRLGIVFQDHALFPHLTVRQNLAFGITRMPRPQQQSIIAELLHKLEIDDLADRFPHELSGGQQQRVALGRALAPNPDIILLDEPFSSLDTRLRMKMKRELRTLLRSFGVTALMITHSPDEAFDIADEMGVVSDRRITQWGTPYDLYHHPCNQTVAEFLGRTSRIEARVTEEGRLETELGVLPGFAVDYGIQGSRCSLLLRPDDVIHDDQAPPIAEVAYVTFRGMYQILGLRLPSGSELFCFVSSHHETHAVGTRIGLRLDMQHVVVLN